MKGRYHNNPISKMLEAEAESRGWSDTDMAMEMDIAQPTYFIGYVKGRTSMNLFNRVSLLCDICGCDPNALFGWNEKLEERCSNKDKLDRIAKILNEL